MTTVETPQTPAEYEKQYLSKLEEQSSVLLSRTLAFSNMPATGYNSQQIAAFISHLQEWEKYFLTFQPAAEYLTQEGLPQTSIRLTAILNDLHSAIQIHQQTYQNTVNAERERNRIYYQTQQEVFDIYRRGMEHQQRVFEDSNRQWGDVFRGYSMDRKYCAHCGYEIANYQVYSPCPHCGQMLS